MVSFAYSNGLACPPRSGRLMALQEEIYRQLVLLIPDAIAHHDHLKSRVSGSPPLHLQVFERHPYTTFLRLTYAFEDGDAQVHNPNAHIRVYHDARVAEVTSFSGAQGVRRFASPYLPARNVLLRSWRQSRALDKWLSYLLHQGHTVDSMLPGEPLSTSEVSQAVPVEAS